MSARAAALVLALLAAPACVSWSTGRRSVEPPAALVAPPPSLHVPGASEATVDAFVRTGLFSGVGVPEEEADLVVTLARTTEHDEGWGFVLSACTLFLLPLPAFPEEHELRAVLRAPALEETAAVAARRKLHVWFAIPLLPLSFLQVDRADLSRSMATELARRVAAGYQTYVRDAWSAARASPDPRALTRFLAAFPQSAFGEEARVELEDLYWRRAAGGSADDAFAYLREFPDSPRAERVLRERARPSWREIAAERDPARVEAYLQAFGPHAARGEAEALLEELLWERTQAPGGLAPPFRDYLARYPSGAHAAEAADVLAFAEAEAARTPEALEAYLRAYPDGAHAERARELLELLTGPGRELASREIEQVVRAHVAANDPRTDPGQEVDLNGALSFQDGRMNLSLTYRATYAGDQVRYEVTSGRITWRGTRYAHGRDGGWYPFYELVYR